LFGVWLMLLNEWQETYITGQYTFFALQLMSLRTHFMQQFKAMYTCKSITSVTSVLFTNTYSLCHWEHILYNSWRQCTLANQSPLLHLFCLQIQLMSMTAHFIQQFTQCTLAIYTCKSVTSATFVLFTNTYSLCRWQHILYNNSRQCTHAIYTCKSFTSVTFFLFTITVLWYSYNYTQHITCGRKGIKIFSITEEEWHVSWAHIRLNQANC